MKLDLIDTRVGTENYPSYSNGNTVPYTGVPFGMNFFAPQTDEGAWWFNPNKPMIQGFRCTHQPSPWMGDFSSFLITPFTGTPELSSLVHLQSSYRTQEATFAPHLLNLTSERYALTSSLTASTYGMILQSASLRKESLHYVLSAGNGIQTIQTDENQITFTIQNMAAAEDSQFTMFVTLHLSVPFTIETSTFVDGSTILIIHSEVSQCELSLATSFISSEQAQLNLSRMPDSFDALQEAAAHAWNQRLNTIEVQHQRPEELKMFYSALYRVFLFPQTFFEYDVNDQPLHYNTRAKKVVPGVLYTNNGFWDTYKTVFPLFSLIAPDIYESLLEGFLNSYKDTGFLPKWLSPDERGLMPGTLIAAVISDGLLKGLGHKNAEELYQAMKHDALTASDDPKYGRRAVKEYQEYGYVPADYPESVNQSLDNSYSDFCIAQVATLLGHEEDAKFFNASAKNYQKLFDSETGLMRAKDREGNHPPHFNDVEWGHAYTEGSAWQNSWGVYHDIQGLINLYASPQAFLTKINQLVNQEPRFAVGSYGLEIHEMSEMAALDFGQMAISNQPSFHIPYLFTYAQKPASTQVLLRSLMRETFQPTYTGYPGDEDNGSMSAWYIFNGLGFYPVCPGSNEYVLGIPFFDEVKLHLGSGNTLTITTLHNTPQHNFVNKVILNNQDTTKLYLRHDDIMKGGNLRFELALVPEDKIYTAEDLPFSMSLKLKE